MNNYLRESPPNPIKEINKKSILLHIQENKGISRATLANRLNLSKPTVSKIVEELLVEEWITETYSVDSNPDIPGRKPFNLYFNKEARYLIGVDIGGTNVDIGILNLDGELQSQSVIQTQQYTKDDQLIIKISDEIEKLRESIEIPQSKILAVGVGAPGITNSLEGIVYEAPSLSWINYPLKQKLQQHLSYQVYIENDVNVAVLGEQWKGAAKGKDNVILITLGTGVGCGIITQNKIYHGSNFAAGEIGYMVTDKNSITVNEGIFSGYGFLDNRLGGPSIVKRMKNRVSTLKAYKEDDINTAEKIFNLAINGDLIALEIVEEVIEHLGTAIINIISIINPQCIVLGGGIANSGYWFVPKVQEMVNSYMPFQTEIFITKLQNVSLIGAAALCLDKLEIF